MSIFAILFYFGSGMFISFVLLLGLSLLYKVPGAVFEVQNDSSLRVVGVALLVLALPVMFELFRDFFPAESVFADYVIPSVDALAAAFLILAVFSFLRHNRYAVLSFLAIGVSALVVFLFVAIFRQVQIFLVLVGIWLIALLAVSVVRAIRFRASIKCGNSFRVVVLLLFFLLNFVLNPFFLYVSITARDVRLFSVFFSLTWMSMGIVLLNVVISSFAASDDEGCETLQAVGAADVPDTSLADDSDRRTADDYFSVDQQQKMKAQLEKIMVKDKLYRSADLCVSDLVKRFDTNASYFYYFMRDVMHSSFFDYVNGYRVEEAKELLLKGDKVDYIILRVGFNSDTTFRRAFKRVTGLTPTEWKLQNGSSTIQD